MTIELLNRHPNDMLSHYAYALDYAYYGDPIPVRLNNFYDVPFPITEKTINDWIEILKGRLQTQVVDAQYTYDLIFDIMKLEDIRTGGIIMPDREKVIKGLETCIPMKYETNEEKKCRHEKCPYGRENYKPMNGCLWDLMTDALALLKEQEDEKKRIMKVIWDTLHEGLSIDAVADQDWVYERIRHRIEDT